MGSGHILLPLKFKHIRKSRIRQCNLIHLERCIQVHKCSKTVPDTFGKWIFWLLYANLWLETIVFNNKIPIFKSLPCRRLCTRSNHSCHSPEGSSNSDNLLIRSVMSVSKMWVSWGENLILAIILFLICLVAEIKKFLICLPTSYYFFLSKQISLNLFRGVTTATRSLYRFALMARRTHGWVPVVNTDIVVACALGEKLDTLFI